MSAPATRSLKTPTSRLTAPALLTMLVAAGAAGFHPAHAEILVTPPVFQSGGGLDPGDVESTPGDLVYDADTQVTLSSGALVDVSDGSLLQAGSLQLLLGDGLDGPILRILGTAVDGTPSRVALNGSVDRLVIDTAGEIFIADGGVLDASLDPGSCQLASCNVYLGRVLGSTARLDVTGTGSRFTTLNQLIIAGAGQGFGPAPLSSASVSVLDGGRIDSLDVLLSTGTFTSSQGALATDGNVTIDGAGSVWSARRFLAADGPFASATITLSNGGRLELSDSLRLGVGAGSSAQLNLFSGATLTSTGGVDGNAALIAGGDGASSVINVDASSLRIDALEGRGSGVRIGAFGSPGTGELNVTGGGEVHITEALSSSGRGFAIGDGLLNVSGAGSRFILDSRSTANVDFSAGVGANGTIAVSDGGLIFIDGGQGNGIVTLAGGASSLGVLDISGAGSRFEITGSRADLFFNRSATVSVTEGGNLSLTPTTAAGGRILIGRNADPDGELGDAAVSVASGGSIFVDGDIEISRAGDPATSVHSSLIVGDGGAVEATRRIRINGGGLLGGTGTVTTDRLEVDEGGVLAAENLIFTDVRELVLLQVAPGRRLPSLSLESDLVLGSGLGNLVAEQDTTAEIEGDLVVRSASGSSSSVTVDAATLRLFGGDILIGSGGGTDVFSARRGSFVETVDQGAGTRMLIGTGGLFETSGAETYTFIEGDIDVLGGELRIGADTIVESFATRIADGGLLSGNGLLRSLAVDVGSGGTLSAGLSPGRLEVQGDLTVDGGTLLFEIGGTEPGSYDVIAVSRFGSDNSGNFNFLSGDFVLRLIDGYVPTEGTELRLIEAEGALFVDTRVNFRYDGFGPDYTFTVRSFTDPFGDTLNGGFVSFLATDITEIAGLTPNHQSMAQALNELCPRVESLEDPTAGEVDLDRLCGGLRSSQTTPEQLEAGLAALTPEEITGTLNSLLRYTTFQHGNLSQRINVLRYGGKRVDFSGLNLRFDEHVVAGRDLQRLFGGLQGGGASADDDFGRWGFFGNGAINRGDKDPTSNDSGFEFDGASLTLGADYRIRDNLFVGAALGYNDLTADFDTDGGLDFSSLSLSLFGTWLYEDAGYLDALATWGRSETDTRRRVVFQDSIGPVDRTARADAGGDQLIASLGGGWDFEAGGFIFGPHAGINFIDISVNRLAESGAAGADMFLPEQEVRSLTANAGVHVSYTFLPSFGVLVPHARLDYVREFEDDAETINIRFVNDRFAGDPLDPTSPISVRTDAPDSDYLVWSVGASAQFTQGIAAFVNYRGSSLIEDISLGELTVGLRMERSF